MLDLLQPLQDQSVLGLLELFHRDRVVEVHRHQPLEPLIAGGDLRLELRPIVLDFSGTPLLDLIQLAPQNRGELIRDCHHGDRVRDLALELFLADVRLHALTTLARTPRVAIAALLLQRDDAAAHTATQETTVQERLEARRLDASTSVQHPTTLLEELPRDDRLVLAVVELPLVADDAVVQRVLQGRLDLGDRRRLPPRRHQPELHHLLAKLLEAIVTRRVQLEHLLDERPVRWVLDDRLAPTIVEVPQRSGLRPDTAHGLLTLATGDVLAEIVHVVLGLAQHDAEHELTVGRGLKLVRREPQVLDLACVHQMNHPTGIERVACQSVGVPRQDAFGLATLDAVEHGVEDRAARYLGTLFLGQAIDDDEAFSFRERGNLGELIADRALLPRRVVGRLASVDEVTDLGGSRGCRNGC